MPIAFKCNSCDKPFRVADEMAGRKAKCPGCATMLTVPSPVRAGTAKAPTPRPAARSRPAPPPEPEEDDYEVVDDDEDGDDEEQVAATPPRRRPAAKAAPSRRKRDEEEDEEPAVADDEEPDDEDDTPKKKKKRGKKAKKKEKKSPVGMILLIGGLAVVLLLLLGGGGVLIYTLTAGGVGGMEQALTFAPESCQSVVSIRWDDIEKSSAFQSINAANPNALGFNQAPEARILMNKGLLQGIILTGTSNPTGPTDSVGYFKLKQSITADELKGASIGRTFTESKVGSYTVMESNIGESFCLLNNTTVLMGNNDALRTVLQRNKKPALSKDLEKAMAEADWNKHISFAVSARSVKTPGMQVPGLDNQLDSVEAIGGYATFTTEVTAHVAAVCRDDKAAADLKKSIDDTITQLKTLLGNDPEFRGVFDGLRFSNAGSKMIVDVAVKGDTIANLARKQQQPPPFPGQPIPGQPPGPGLPPLPPGR